MICFKNTHHALQYGQSIKGNKEAIEALKEHRLCLLDRIQGFIDRGNLKEALYLASGQGQFSREALENTI